MHSRCGANSSNELRRFANATGLCTIWTSEYPENSLKKHSVTLFLLGLALTLFALGLTLPASALIIISLVVESHTLVRLTRRPRRSINL